MQDRSQETSRSSRTGQGKADSAAAALSQPQRNFATVLGRLLAEKWRRMQSTSANAPGSAAGQQAEGSRRDL